MQIAQEFFSQILAIFDDFSKWSAPKELQCRTMKNHQKFVKKMKEILVQLLLLLNPYKSLISGTRKPDLGLDTWHITKVKFSSELALRNEIKLFAANI